MIVAEASTSLRGAAMKSPHQINVDGSIQPNIKSRAAKRMPITQEKTAKKSSQNASKPAPSLCSGPDESKF